ncbi:MAG: transcriptional repressor [Sedimentisphaerales bacterium]|nr:transcriptional repressor [Sedimentisphaerales bacterium]
MNKKDDKINSTELDEKNRQFTSKCREAGLKVTPQRMVIYRELLQTDEHPSAEMLYEKVKETLPNISLDTVNRTLLTFNEIGVAFTVEGSGGARRYDGGLREHQHFRCVKCKKIIDFHHKPFDNIRLPPEIKNKFTVLRKSVYLEGLCNLCV